MFIRKILPYAILGWGDDMTHKHQKDLRLRLLLAYIWISAIAILLYSTQFLLQKLFMPAMIQLLFLIPFIIAIYALKNKHRLLGIIVSVIASISLVFVQTLFLFGNATGFHYQYFPLIVVIFLVSDLNHDRQKNLALSFGILSSLGLIVCELFGATPLLPGLYINNFTPLKTVSLFINLMAMLTLLYIYANELAKKEQLMDYLANHDALTNLHNRGCYTCLSEELFKEAKSKNESLSVLMLDIDDFKKINDEHSHAGGDTALISLANRIRTLVPTSAEYCRYGGEEFAITLPGYSGAMAQRLAEDIRREIGQMAILFDNSVFEMTVSIGVSSMKDPHQYFEEMIAEADHLLYTAKRHGKNCISSR